jgi:hypothetical protein
LPSRRPFAFLDGDLPARFVNELLPEGKLRFTVYLSGANSLRWRIKPFPMQFERRDRGSVEHGEDNSQ